MNEHQQPPDPAAEARAAFRDQLVEWFTYHPPTPDLVPAYTAVRRSALDFALTIAEFAPASHERDAALARLREAMMWANAAIACNPKEPR